MKSIRSVIKLFYLFILLFLSCKKFVEVPIPSTVLASQNVFTSDASATSAMVGTYSTMISSGGFASGGVVSITQLAGLSADEFLNYSTDPLIGQFFTNELSATNSDIENNLWSEGYKYIYSSNAVLEGLETAIGVSDTTKNQLLGEAKFIRAFCHFYLVNLFGDIPLITTTNYKMNAISSRTPTAMVYNQIISDLKSADSLLANDYNFSNGERVRPNRWVAKGLLARVYLYLGDWTDAKSMATAVINNTGLFQLNTDLNSVFLKNSNETIFQLMPVIEGLNTNEGQTFILTDAPQNVALTPSLLNAFEPGDLRKFNWVDSVVAEGQTYFFAYKYRVKASADLTEYSMVLRLAEQYLIRAEAEAELNDLTNAAGDLNIIRNRAGLPPTVANSQTDLLIAITHERQTELFSEWGHRWFDLKRTQSSDAVLGPVKGPGWQSTDTLYPIPKMEITNDPQLKQNPGY